MATGYDSANASTVPAGGDFYLGYIDGAYQTYEALRARFPHARILSITTGANGTADIADCEQGDLTPQQAAAGYGTRWHTIYCSRANWIAVNAAMGGRPWNWFAADPTGVPHLVKGSVATQWAWPGYGSPGNYDISQASDHWLNPKPPAPPKPEVPPMAVSTVTSYRPKQLDVFQCSTGALWHKFQLNGGNWANECLLGPAGGKASATHITVTSSTPQVAHLNNQTLVTVEDNNARVWCLSQDDNATTWGCTELP